MEIQGARVLLLGGSGLVGIAIARRLLEHGPASLVISALTREEAEAGVAELRAESAAGEAALTAEWGDVFLPLVLKDRRRADALADPGARSLLLDDLYGEPGADAVARNTLGDLLLRHRPTLVIDCINTATVFAYQNVYAGAADLRKQAASGHVDPEAAERHLATLYLPQLIRHVQLAGEGMRQAGTRMYLKIGTAGTGGMGLNIPFTHSEERPSRMLLAKSSLAGAHTLLLFLMARTPGGPAVKEIKPTAAISWKRIGTGPVLRGRKPISRIETTQPVSLRTAFGSGEQPWRDTGEALTGVWLDAGENGLFSPPEFEALTALGLMEFITPEEIADDAVREITGAPSGHDVVAALDASTSGPTFRAGVMRQAALNRMATLEREQGVESVAYEMLGPPRLSKLLWEAALLSRVTGGSLEQAAKLDPQKTASAVEACILGDADLRSRIVSIGLPILLPDGERVLRGPDVKVPPAPDGDAPAALVDAGWVDLRAGNWERWRERVAAVLRGSAQADVGSRWDLDAGAENGQIRPGALAAWIFRHEDGGERVKR
ncbi:MAG: short-chain dehydrogenase [Gemmatimonadota bacterium]|nr:short-chain dehydrogenase [Gemmatimonadota bacterium]